MCCKTEIANRMLEQMVQKVTQHGPSRVIDIKFALLGFRMILIEMDRLESYSFMYKYRHFKGKNVR